MLLFEHLVFGQTLMIFGGDDHDVYLGKLNASEYDSESIWNEYGSYGNSYSSTSIWNEYSSFLMEVIIAVILHLMNMLHILR